jgi:hypothetical protein
MPMPNIPKVRERMIAPMNGAPLTGCVFLCRIDTRHVCVRPFD